MGNSIKIDTVRIAGFRGIQDLEVSLPRVAVLVGTNNSGKTSLLKALQLALGDYSRYVNKEDFYINPDSKRVSEIKIDVRLVPTDEDGERIRIFDTIWQAEFGDKIKAEADGNQFVAIRTWVKPNEIKGGFESTRYTLQVWPEYNVWKNEETKEKDKVARITSTPLIAIEAQRDIHHDLKDKFSFAGKILSEIEYEGRDVDEIEKLIQELNKKTINKSDIHKNLKTHLEKLNQSFQGADNVEITPFPRKVRDLLDHFSIYFGEGESTAFPMEYHGMGVRSWASMLTAKAFIEAQVEKHEVESKPFFPILAAEEPEAHLHPNAQKTLYSQLSASEGQVIVSTHSPYFAATVNIRNIRSMHNGNEGISIRKINPNISNEERKILAREIMSKKGEILFAKALILAEGITEEQIIPAMCDLCMRPPPLARGISCVGVNGKNYAPFVKFACSFGIPTYIISDNDGSTKTEIESQLGKIRNDGYDINENIFGISYLASGNDFEVEILNILKEEIIKALILSEINSSGNPKYIEAKRMEISALNDNQILEKMRNNKALYSGFLADVIRENPGRKDPSTLIPKAVADAFEQITEWLET